MANITLTNLIPVPSMDSGWSIAPEPVDAKMGGYGGGSVVLLAGTTSTKEIILKSSTNIALDNTHIYYARCYGYQETTASGSIDIYWPSAEPAIVGQLSAKSAGHWRMYSATSHRNTFTNGSYPFRIDFNNNYAASSMYISSPMLIDLTACFGAGKEPTVDWCDEFIPFFSGTKTFNNHIWRLKNVTPIMTSNTTPSGYVVSASTEIIGTYADKVRLAWCAFDSLSSPDQEIDRWHSAAGIPQWIMLKFPEKRKIRYFSIKNCGDQHNGINAFKLQGSNDGSTFTDLGSYTNPKDLGVTTYYPVTNIGKYQYYRLYITSTHHSIGTTTVSYYCIIDEINFYEAYLEGAIKVNDSWKNFYEVKVNVNGQWKKVTSLLNHKNSKWN